MKIRLHSAIIPKEGDRETTDSLVPVRVGKLDGIPTFTYVETSENGKVTTRIIAGKERVRVERTGAVNSRITFEAGKTDRSLYEIPPFRFDLRVDTLKVSDSLSSEGGRLDLLYDMDIGGEVRRVHFAAVLEPEEENG